MSCRVHSLCDGQALWRRTSQEGSCLCDDEKRQIHPVHQKISNYASDILLGAFLILLHQDLLEACGHHIPYQQAIVPPYSLDSLQSQQELLPELLCSTAFVLYCLIPRPQIPQDQVLFQQPVDEYGAPWTLQL